MKDFRKIAISVAIAILLTLFVGYTVDLFYESPEFSSYCNVESEFARPIPINRENNCQDFKYDFNSCYNSKGHVQYEYDTNGCISNATCSDCNISYENAKEKYSTISFIILSIIGAIAIILGIYFFLNPVSHGFLLGGILIIIYATMRSFSDFGKITRVIVLGLELIVLIWASYKKFGKENNKKK
jgi:hypothetical protein